MGTTSRAVDDGGDDVSDNVFAARIKALRKRLGLRQEDLASASGLSHSYVSMIERGNRTPSHVAMQQIAAGLEVPLVALFVADEAVALRSDNPAYQRLVTFARDATLTRKQVELLIAVGKVLFSGKAPP
jgi:transcriptional regulator with XRE-family HTH domain